MQPILFTIGEAFSSLDLAPHYKEYQIIHFEREERAIERLEHLKRAQMPVVLFIVGQDDLSFLVRAKALIPTAKSLMVGTHSQALSPLHFKIDAIVGTYMPPEDFLYPVIDALVEQSLQQSRLETASALFRGIRVLGHRYSAEAYQIKDFLARHAIAFEWVDLEAHPEAVQVFAHEKQQPVIPLLQFSDGTWLSRPTSAQIAEKIGLAMKSEIPFYDLIIVGGGPAGLAAAVYGASEGLRTVVIERDVPGGQAGMSSRIENYLGFPVGLSGSELAARSVAQAARLGAHILSPQEVKGVRVEGTYRYVRLADGSEIGCYALLIATGVAYRSLAVPGIDHFTGSGVYYGAAMTEAASCKDKQVCIVGGANSAGQAALYFAEGARQVSILVRGTSLEASMSSYLIEELRQRDNIDVQIQTEVVQCIGNETLEHLSVVRNGTGTKEIICADALFIFIGSSPHTQWLPESIARDQAGFVLAGSAAKTPLWDREPLHLETSLPGVFVAGDVRSSTIKRVACAAGDGAVAVSVIHEYLRSVC